MFSNKLFKKYCSSEWMIIFESNKQIINVKAKERIFNEGDEVKGIFFIEEGRVKVISTFNEGDEKILRVAGNDTILGHRGINYKHYHISAEALTDTRLTFLPIDIFIKILKANPGMSIYLINFLTEELREAEERLRNLLILDPKKRIALILLKLIDTFGYSKVQKNLLQYTLSRTDMANMAGTTYETIIRTLSHFEDMKLIELVGKKIAIKKEDKLRALAVDKKPAGK